MDMEHALVAFKVAAKKAKDSNDPAISYLADGLDCLTTAMMEEIVQLRGQVNECLGHLRPDAR